METIAKGIAMAYRAEVCVDIEKGSMTVMNDEKLCELVQEAAGQVIGEKRVIKKLRRARMGSDDFANYASRVPGVYFNLCTRNPDKGITGAGHSPYFDLDEEVLWEGAATYAAIALKYLGDK